MSNEGIIKFTCSLIEDEPPDSDIISELNEVRNELFRLGYIGVNSDNIGYGNISMRYDADNSFIITGTQTGAKKILTPADYTIVTKFNIAANTLTCRGKVKASSESLTHAAAYSASARISAVIHIHSKKIWLKLYNSVLATPEECSYGTPQLALEIKKICRKNYENIIVLKGHEEGIIITSGNLQDALALTKSL